MNHDQAPLSLRRTRLAATKLAGYSASVTGAVLTITTARHTASDAINSANRESLRDIVNDLPNISRTFLNQGATPQGATPNVKMVFDRYVSPGRRIVGGKFEWFGESGKCCVSRQNPPRAP